MPSECAAVGCCEKLTKETELSFHVFPLKTEAPKRQWQVAVGRRDAATKKLWEQKHHDLLCSKHFKKKKKKMPHRSNTAEHSVWAQIQCSAERRGCTNSVCQKAKTKNNDRNRPGQTGEHWRNVASERQEMPDKSSVWAHPDQTFPLPTRVVVIHINQCVFVFIIIPLF